MKTSLLYIFTIIFWDFRLRPPARRGHRGLRPGGISDWWNRYTLSIIMDRSTRKLTTGRSTKRLTTGRIPYIRNPKSI